MLIPLTVLTGLANIANFYFCQFFICAFHLVFVVATTNLSFFFIKITLNGLKFDMLMHPDHLQNWVDFSRHLLIFLILALFGLSNTGQICNIFVRMQVKNDLKFVMLMYPELLQTLFDFGHGFLIFLVLASFGLSETGQIGGSWRFSTRCIGGMA